MWHVAPTAGLLWTTWGDECVVYHGASGDTHLLNPIAADILRRLQSSPASVQDVERLLGEGSRPHAETLIGRFADLGLIVPLDDAR